MSVVRLLVLGVVLINRRAHGYAVQRELRSWKVETWTSVKPGSIYHALNQLSKEEMLRAVGVEEGAAGPERRLYELTESGLAEFRQLLEAALTSVGIEELGVGVAFMHTLPRRHALDRLREQHRHATEIRDNLEGMKAGFLNGREPPHTRELLALWSGSVGATAQFTEALIQRLEAGEYAMADDDTPGPPPESGSTPAQLPRDERHRERGGRRQ